MKNMKKAVSLVLCAVLLVCLAVPAGAAGESSKKYPIILVNDVKETPLYDKDGRKVYPFDYNTNEMKNKLTDTMPAFIYGVASGDYRSWVSEFKEIINGYYAPLALDENGNISNGTHCNFTYNSFNVKKNGGSYYDYSFFYDWRLSPIKTAELLKDYIDAVIRTENCKKVSLVGNGYGSTVILAYLNAYGSSKIDTAVFNSSFANATKAADALFTGKIRLNPNAMLNYFDNGNDVFGDKDLTEILMSLFSALNTVNLLGKPSGSIEEALEEFYTAVAPEILPLMHGGYPSYWTMVSPDLVKSAKEFVFEGKENKYLGFIQKIDKYYQDIQVNIDKILEVNVNLGMKIAVITKYGFASLPLNKNSDMTGDGSVEAANASFGANCAAYGNVLSKEYIASVDGKYLSSDHIIDASTCLYPNRTWFIKELNHNENPSYLEEFIYDICNYDGVMTVFNNQKYTQFLKYSEEYEKLSPMKDPPVVISSVQDTISSIIRFAQSIFGFIGNLLKKFVSTILPNLQSFPSN